jgi:uncharacterized protein (TIGR03083 family)
MPAFGHLRYCDELELEIERLATAAGAADLERVVPTCPDWTARELIDHCGSTLLWGAALVARLSPRRLRGSELELAPPAGRSGDADWLRECGGKLVLALRVADPDAPMWAWGADQHVRFWSRRMLHESLVHRIDLQITAGTDIEVDPPIAADCVDEHFANLHRAATFSPRVLEISGAGETIGVRCSDVPQSWTIALVPGDFAISSGTPPAPDVSVTGPARELMLLFNRRAAVGEVSVEIAGDLGVLETWLDKSALE